MDNKDILKRQILTIDGKGRKAKAKILLQIIESMPAEELIGLLREIVEESV